MLFNKTRQYNIQIFNKIILFKYRTRQIRTTETNKKLLILIKMEVKYINQYFTNNFSELNL